MRLNKGRLQAGFLASMEDDMQVPFTGYFVFSCPISRVYSAKFICKFNMGVYPFDTQECTAVFTLKVNQIGSHRI